ncbi:GNAT family N-acetyltransferase [Actinospica sp.]|jgi:homoserine kinase type II|uniref:GNAT family N-acetyltransferase n=1 Tax=Actinospica sp. TaxID=1872142 RepID=UPI002CAFFBB6|nr:GNAT family N-acetyltransferase [Actinospica sp.]HWG28409.1 GNAT family N-acetyltransferase [Actinospica sp.]
MSDSALLSPSALARLLAEQWRVSTAEITAHDGGMSSSTWVVTEGARRWLAKAVSAERYGQRFASGLAAATRLDEAGIPAGAPIPTRDGALTVEDDGAAVALLSWVEGSPVEQHTTDGMRLVGRTLARAHLALGGAPARAHIEPRLDPAAPHLWIRPWIRPALAAARAAVEALAPDTLTWGPLHGDPAAEAFLVDPDAGTVGLIDWGAYTVGPRVFDLASAVMYAGSPEKSRPLIEAYLAEGALSSAEVERALGAMLGWRWASQAYYFAHRIATGDMTGIADPAENERGLADAKAYLDPARIRAYRPADETEWARCRAVAFLDTAYYDAVEPRKPVEEADAVIDLVAVDGDEVVGILDVAVRGDLATIETVCVHPDHRRYGIATRLLREAIQRLDGSPARVLDAWTREDASALAWYSAHGFVEEHTYLHAYSGYGSANTSRMAEPRDPFRPVIIFAHAQREHEQQVRAEFERVYVCRRLVKQLAGS